MVPGRVFRRVSCALVLSFATTVASAESPTLTKIKSNGSVTLGYREASIPFSYLGTDQKPVGFSLDLCAQVVAKIKSDLKLDTLAVKLQPVDSTNRIPLIQNGTIDMECGATSSSVARLKQVAFTVAIFVSSARWLTKVSSGIHDVKDLDGKTVRRHAGLERGRLRVWHQGQGRHFQRHPGQGSRRVHADASEWACRGFHGG